MTLKNGTQINTDYDGGAVMIRQLTIVSLILCFVSTLSTHAGTWRDDFEDGNLDDWVIG